VDRVSGRARVVVYNTDVFTPDELPDNLEAFTDPSWAGRIGWVPTNASFQAMVTAMRVAWGEEKTRAWLEGILANDVVAYDGNAALVEAVANGEIDLGFVNHYYLYRFLSEQGEGFKAPQSLLIGWGARLARDGGRRRTVGEWAE